jgi:hypothetical protein
MRFVVDESSWNFDAFSSEQFVEALEIHLDRLDDAILDNHQICYSDDLFNRPVYDGKSFYELYEDGSEMPVPHEIRERIGTIFGRMSHWQDLANPLPASSLINIASTGPTEASSIAWAITQVLNSNPYDIACIIVPKIRQGGLNEIEFNGNITQIFFIATEEDYRRYFRTVISKATNSATEMALFCDSAFSQLDFVPGCLQGIKNMSRPYREIISDVIHHLSVLNDFGKQIFAARWQDAPAKFGSHGVEISDENGKTKQNSKAKKARELKIGNDTIFFWWHTKIEAHRDRIHIYPDNVPTGGKIIVGIFCNHLVT